MKMPKAHRKLEDPPPLFTEATGHIWKYDPTDKTFSLELINPIVKMFIWLDKIEMEELRSEISGLLDKLKKK